MSSMSHPYLVEVTLLNGDVFAHISFQLHPTGYDVISGLHQSTNVGILRIVSTDLELTAPMLKITSNPTLLCETARPFLCARCRQPLRTHREYLSENEYIQGSHAPRPSRWQFHSRTHGHGQSSCHVYPCGIGRLMHPRCKQFHCARTPMLSGILVHFFPFSASCSEVARSLHLPVVIDWEDTLRTISAWLQHVDLQKVKFNRVSWFVANSFTGPLPATLHTIQIIEYDIYPFQNDYIDTEQRAPPIFRTSVTRIDFAPSHRDSLLFRQHSPLQETTTKRRLHVPSPFSRAHLLHMCFDEFWNNMDTYVVAIMPESLVAEGMPILGPWVSLVPSSQLLSLQRRTC